MKAAGCIVIGKTNTPEFGLGSHTFNEVFGVTRNAYDPSRSAGGSSGGAAVALALRMLAVADGSDSMGSVRNPAAWNNVFGMRPSMGRVPLWPAQDVWFSAARHRGPDGTHGARRRAAARRAGRARPARAALARWPRALCGIARSRRPRTGCASAGSAISPVTWPPNRASSKSCESGLARLRDCGCIVASIAPNFSPDEVWKAWLKLRRWLVAARLAPWLGTSEHRSLIKPEALWEADEGARLTSPELMAASVQRTQFLPADAEALRRSRRPGAADDAGVAVRCTRALAAAHRHARNGHLPSLDGSDALRDLRRPARDQRAGRLQRVRACQPACS